MRATSVPNGRSWTDLTRIRRWRLWATPVLQSSFEVVMTYSQTKAKSVFVRAYLRFRFGKQESVCQHWRSAPYQYVLFA
jgi:hypothetical protein